MGSLGRDGCSGHGAEWGADGPTRLDTINPVFSTSTAAAPSAGKGSGRPGGDDTADSGTVPVSCVGVPGSEARADDAETFSFAPAHGDTPAKTPGRLAAFSQSRAARVPSPSPSRAPGGRRLARELHECVNEAREAFREAPHQDGGSVWVLSPVRQRLSRSARTEGLPDPASAARAPHRVSGAAGSARSERAAMDTDSASEERAASGEGNATEKSEMDAKIAGRGAYPVASPVRRGLRRVGATSGGWEEAQVVLEEVEFRYVPNAARPGSVDGLAAMVADMKIAGEQGTEREDAEAAETPGEGPRRSARLRCQKDSQ